MTHGHFDAEAFRSVVCHNVTPNNSIRSRMPCSPNPPPVALSSLGEIELGQRPLMIVSFVIRGSNWSVIDTGAPASAYGIRERLLGRAYSASPALAAKGRGEPRP